MKNIIPYINHLSAMMPVLTLQQKLLANIIYQTLALGESVSMAMIMKKLNISTVEAKILVNSLDEIEKDQQSNITGFRGLSLTRGEFNIQVNNRQLFCWCAFDTLFVADLLSTPCKVIAQCGQSQQALSFTIDRNEIIYGHCESIFMSLALPSKECYQSNLQACFCHYVKFFKSKKLAQTWAQEYSDICILPLQQAFELAKQRNLLFLGYATSKG